MEFMYRFSSILNTSKKFEAQARVLLKIAKPFFLNASSPHNVVNEKEQEFVWSYFCLEKNFTKGSCWQKMGEVPAKNDQYMIKIINYLNECQQKSVILTQIDYSVVGDLLNRLIQYKALRADKLVCVRLKENSSDIQVKELI